MKNICSLTNYLKISFLLVSCLSLIYAQGQDNSTYNHFRIPFEEGYIEIQCLPTQKPDIEISSERMYAWCNRKVIFETQGGYSYYLLHGPYERFDKAGHLIEKGQYDMGLRTGQWTKWQITGKLLEDAYYRDGQLHGIVNYFDQNGRIHKSAQYQNGALNGCTYVYESDSVMVKNKYKNGRLVKGNEPEDK